MVGEVTTGNLRVELCVRSLYPSGQGNCHERTIARLERLDEKGALEEFDVRIWGDQVALSSAGSRTTAGEQALGRYGQFRKWADENDRSIDGVFDVRDVEVQFTGESYTALVFPSLVLAEYEGDELRHLTPHADGAEVHTVSDRLERLEAELVDDVPEQAPADIGRRGT